MDPEARAVAKLSRAASSFGFSRRRQSTRKTPVPELVDALVDHLVYSEEIGENELPEVLAVAESILTGKDVGAANLVSGVFLEKLLLVASFPDNGLQTEAVEQLLGTHCRAAWHELERLWLTVADDIEGRPNNPTIGEYLRLTSTQLRREFRAHYRVMPTGELVGMADILAWEAGYRYVPMAPFNNRSETTTRKDEGVA